MTQFSNFLICHFMLLFIKFNSLLAFQIQPIQPSIHIFYSANSPNFQSVFFAGGSIIAISFNETHIIGEYQLTAPPYTSKFLFIKFSELSLPNNAFSEHQVRIWNGNKNYTTEESRFILIGPKRVFEIKSF